MSESINLSGHKGNISLIEYPHTAFLCSRIVPANNVAEIIQWAENYTDSSHCIVCGCQTSVEYQVVLALLRNRVPVIIVFSTAIPEPTDKEWLLAIEENRLLLLSKSHDEKPSSDAYQERNALIMDMCDHIVVGYCTRGGNIAHQLLGRTNVSFLSAYNEYDNQDRILWSKTHNLTDNGTLLAKLHSLNGRESYLELTKAFYSHQSHRTEYTTIYIPQADIQALCSLGMEADLIQKNHQIAKDYKSQHNDSGSSAAESLMPWDVNNEPNI